MTRASIRVLRGDRRGVTVVEFALIAPVMLMMILMLCDLMYQLYAQSLLDGAVQKGGRDSAIQGGGDNAAAIDAKVVSILGRIAPNANWSATRENYNSFSVIKPEVIEDKNSNGVLDSKECFYDVNGNSTWDANPSRSGQGNANEVTKYTVTVTYPRLFPIATLVGASATEQIKATTLLKNQPYARQVRTTNKVCLP